MAEIDNNLLNSIDSLGLSKKEEPKSTGEMGQDEFMQLMLAQLENQDPLEPMEDSEFLSQIAQFSTVEGIDALQTSADQLVGSLQASQALQASTLVGRSVLVPTNSGTLNAGEPITGSIELTSSTPQLMLKITDSSGQLVREIPMGAHPSGQVAFSWDGYSDSGVMMPPGSYGVSAEALIGGETQAVSAYVATQVESVTLQQGSADPILNLAGTGPMALSSVRQIM